MAAQWRPGHYCPAAVADAYVGINASRNVNPV